MNDYTPTTEEVQSYYVSGRAQIRRQITGVRAQDITPFSDEFDRWLAAHDAEVTAKALERGVDELGVYVGDEDGDYWTGYRDGQRRQIHVLKMLAAEARADTTNNESEDEK